MAGKAEESINPTQKLRIIVHSRLACGISKLNGAAPKIDAGTSTGAAAVGTVFGHRLPPFSAWCIAGISLVVGGIGIMNIMYVSVTERTREIGLRMSVGARGIDILSQFLIESILISITGGLIGVILGCGASFIIKSVAHWPVFIQPWSVLLSFAVCTFTGVFFGWYPAKKAADLDPIEALRYE